MQNEIHNQRAGERDDRIPMELQLERVPNLFLGRDRNTEVRRATQTFSRDDGSHGSITFQIEPSTTAGDLTPDTRKAFVALMRMLYHKLKTLSPDEPIPHRFDFTLREFAHHLNPQKSRTNAWGKDVLAGIKRHIRKLQKVNIQLEGHWYDADTKTERTVEDGFSLVTHYHIAESKRFESGAEQPPLEMGFVDVLPMLARNIARGYTSPLLAGEQNSLRGKWATILYQYLDNRFTGVPADAPYRRLLNDLFSVDFPELSTKYRYAAHRKRVTERACRELTGKRITTGLITKAHVVKNKDGKEWMLEVRRNYEPYVQPEAHAPDFDAGQQPTSYANWIKHTDPSRGGEEDHVSDLVKTSLDQATAGYLESFLDEIVKRTGDDGSRIDFGHMLRDRKAFASLDQAVSTFRKWLSEIEQHEHDTIDLPNGRRLRIIYTQHCQANGLQPYNHRGSHDDHHSPRT